jgi:hypothetical protein
VIRARPDHEVADATGESVRTVNRLGSSAFPDDPADREPEPLYLAVNRPHCRRPALYPGQLPDGSSPMAGCHATPLTVTEADL